MFLIKSMINQHMHTKEFHISHTDTHISSIIFCGAYYMYIQMAFILQGDIWGVTV